MLFGRRRRAEAAIQREAADRVEIIGLLLEVKGQMDRVVSLLEGSAKVPKGAMDQETKDLLEKNKRVIDEWKNGGEGDRWENL